MLKVLVKGSVIAGVGVTVGSVVEYVYYLSMANMLGPASFGLLSASLSVMFIMLTLITSGIGLSLAKFISENEKPGEIKALLYNGITLALTATCATSLALLLAAFLMLPKTGAGDLSTPLILVSLVMPFLALSAVSATTFQGLNKMGGYSTVIILNAVAKVALAIYLVHIGYGLYGALGAYAVGAVVSAAYGFYVLRKHVDLTQRIDCKLMQKIVLFSLPVAVLTIVIHILLKSDVILLKLLGITNQDIGYYTAAALVARFIYFGSSSVAVAALPLISRERVLVWSRIRKPIALIIAAFVAGNILIALFPTQIITRFFPDEYARASFLIPPLSVAASLLSLGYIASTALIAQGRPYDVLKPLFAGLAIYVAMMAYLTPKMGLHATYVSLITANAVYLVLTLIENKKQIRSSERRTRRISLERNQPSPW